MKSTARPALGRAWRVRLGDLPHARDAADAQCALHRRAYAHLCARIAEPPPPPPPARALEWTDSAADHPLMERAHDPAATRAQIDMDLARLHVQVDAAACAAVRRILLVWARVSALGYQQGMHELAAMAWRVCADEADAFALFSALMRRMADWFGAAAPSLLRALVHRVDPALAAHLAAERMEWPPLVLRWHRVLFLHEFAFDEAVRLWDELISADPSLHLVDYVSAAMVLRVREQVLTAEHGHAPLVLFQWSAAAARAGRASAAHLVTQAMRLRDAPDVDTCAAIVAENAAAFRAI